AISMHPDQGWFCVADGMGGEEAGDKASAFTIEALGAAFDAFPLEDGVDNLLTRKTLAGHAAIKANAHIRDFVRKEGLGQSGSTLALLVFDCVQPDKALVMHAGDSRVYRLRNRALEQITVDHSVAQEAGVKDENDIPLMFRGMVTRALGIKPVVDLEYQTIDVKPDDLYLICSDGLSGMVSDQEIHLILGQKEVDTLDVLADQLIQAALDGGGKDNVSVVLIRVDHLPEQLDGTLRIINVPEDEELISLKQAVAASVGEPATDDPTDESTNRNRPLGDPTEQTDDFLPLTPSNDRPISVDRPASDSTHNSAERMREKLKTFFKPKSRD
ncbi:MAG: serine/threonine protein phosphatase PrpC, partial [Kiritimatiellia bacterium]